MSVLGTDIPGHAMARKIAEVAAGKRHRLAPYQVDGQHPVSTMQFEGIMAYLARCPERPTQEQQMARYRPVTSPAEARVRANREMIGDIPAGFFATPSRTGNNDLDFWKVTVVQSGPYKGYRKVKRVVGGGDSLLPRLIDVSKPEQAAALGAILQAGITTAQEAYADKEERCMKCGRQLTDEDSRARRMGDTCAGKA